MINSISSINSEPAFKGIITGIEPKTGKKRKVNLSLFEPIISTPDMDQAILTAVEDAGLKCKSKQLEVVNLNVELNPAFKKIMTLMRIPEKLVESAWSCSIEKIRPESSKASTRPIIHNLKVTINRTKTIILDLNQKSQGLIDIKPKILK